MTRTIHIVGAGLAGLAAATRLAPRARVVVHEAARMAGGRCRSYFDPALGLAIDNGNHLLLSGNHAAEAYLARTGAKDALAGPEDCVFDFVDLATGERWQLRPNAGRAPWWIFSKDRRVPGAGWRDYLDAIGLLRAGPKATIAQAMTKRGPAWKKLWQPVFVSALNTSVEDASAQLAAAVVRESLGAGGKAARPRVARDGLGAAFIDPALAMLAQHGAKVRFGARLRSIRFEGEKATSLVFADDEVAMGGNDSIILAVPQWIAGDLLPGVTGPTETRAILNAHFAMAPPEGTPLLTGLVGGMSEWLFAFEDRLSVTISDADRFMDVPRESLAADIWREIAGLMTLDPALPRWQIVKEKRATFAATPAQDALRPPMRTRWSNLRLAGDWTATGLPATIEGAIRSGDKAAAAALL